MSRSPHDAPARPPRGLVLGASVWIAISWLSLVGPQPPLQPTSLSYTPAIRMMVQSMLLLTVVGWPLVRLSMPSRDRPVMSAVLDTIAMLVLWQIVLWPMRLVTTWPIGRLALLDVEAISACLAAGAVVALDARRAWTRTAAMIAMLVWAIGLPTLGAWLGLGGSPWTAGPFVRSWQESGLGPGPVDVGAVGPAVATAIAAAVLWIGAARSVDPELAAPPGGR